MVVRGNSNVADGVVTVRGLLIGHELLSSDDATIDHGANKEERAAGTAGVVGVGELGAAIFGGTAAEGAGPGDEEHELEDTRGDPDDHRELGAVEDGRGDHTTDEDTQEAAKEEDGHDAEGGAALERGVSTSATSGVTAGGAATGGGAGLEECDGATVAGTLDGSGGGGDTSDEEDPGRFLRLRRFLWE